jgi:hypothetical protein
MKEFLKKDDYDNPYDHDVERYTNHFDNRSFESQSRAALKRYGWMVLKSSNDGNVIAYRRVK